MAGGAGDGRIDRGVMGVGRGGVFVRRVALQADAVAGHFQLGAVRVVTVAAGDASGEHLALLERAVIIDLVLHLPVGVIEPARERRHRHGYRTAIGRAPNLLKISPRRAWHSPQVSTSLRNSAGGRLRRGRAGLADRSARRCRHARRNERQGPWICRRAVPNGHQLRRARAQATCREPCPWQVSQPTLISAQVVAKRSLAAS